MANTFVLVGDHYQLSPLVKSVDALNGGLDVSLFKMLCEAHPQAVVNLEHQYRMCEEIMQLSNKLIYDGKLKCGSEQVANQLLKIPKLHATDMWKGPKVRGKNAWLDDVLKET